MDSRCRQRDAEGRVSKYTKYTSSKPKAQREVDIKEPITYNTNVRSYQSTNASPIVNKLLTPKIKTVSTSKGVFNGCYSSSGKSIKPFNSKVNSFQTRMHMISSSCDKSPTKHTSYDHKNQRSNNKEASGGISKSKKGQKAKKSLGRLDTAPSHHPTPSLKKTHDNKENVSPNIKPTKPVYSSGKYATTDSNKYQMFSKLLKSMDINQDDNKKVASSPRSFIEVLHSRDQEKSKAPSGIPEEVKELMLNVTTNIGQVWMNYQTGIDYYDTIREYVELAQNREYKRLETCMEREMGYNYVCECILVSSKLERWAIMTVFYFIFATKAVQDRMKNCLKEILQLTLQNSACITKCLTVGQMYTVGGKNVEQAIDNVMKVVMGKRNSAVSVKEIENTLKVNNVKVKERLAEW